MDKKVKAFGAWLLIPFLTIDVIIPLVIAVLRREPHALSLDFQLLAHLAYLAIPAIIGTTAMSLMDHRQRLWAALWGALLAVTIQLLMLLIQMPFLRGFESGVGLYVSTFLLLPPSAVAGAIAGLILVGHRVSPNERASG